MSSEPLTTVEDAVEHLLDIIGSDRSDRSLRQARRAIHETLRTIGQMHQWSYYDRRHKVTTAATYSTGTVTYDHTGGANEKQLTLAGGTWPNEIEWYGVIIGQQQYQVDVRVSDTVVTLATGSSPSADIASTTYTAYRSLYSLPDTFRRMSTTLVNLSRPRFLTPVGAEGGMSVMSGQYMPSEVTHFAITGGERQGRMSLELYPPPSYSETYDFIYEASPRVPTLNADRYTVGSATANGTTTITGNGSSWSGRMVGSIMRFSASGTTPPSGLAYGMDSKAVPYDQQVTVVSVESTTSLTVDSNVSARSGVGYSMSDPIDIDPLTMRAYFDALLEQNFARISRSKDIPVAAAMATQQLRIAKQGDNRVRDSLYGQVTPRGYTLEDIVIRSD